MSGYGPGPAPGGGGSMIVTDGTVTVNPTTTLFLTGAAVTDGGSGEADVVISTGITGTITSGTVPVANSGSTVANSHIKDDLASGTFEMLGGYQAATSQDGYSQVILQNGQVSYSASDNITITLMRATPSYLEIYDNAGTGTQFIDGSIRLNFPDGTPGTGDINISGNYLIHGHRINNTGAGGLTATGTVQSDALPLTETFNHITGGAAATGSALFDAMAGAFCIVENRSGNAQVVYPKDGTADTIAGGASTAIADGTAIQFWCATAGDWRGTVVTAL